MFIHAYKQVIYIIPIVNQTDCRQTRESIRTMSADESVSETPSASRASSTMSTHANTPESKHVVVLSDLTRGPLEMISEVFRVQDRLAATALVHFVSLFCSSFQTFMNKCVCSMRPFSFLTYT